MPLRETLDFISRIEKYPALWRKEDKDFSNRELRRELFGLISSETGIPVEKCKRRLKGLKDRMREICHRLPKEKTGQPAFHVGERLVNWSYYKPLLFMSDQFLAPAKDGTSQIFLTDDFKVKLGEDFYDYDEAGEQIEYVGYNDSVDIDSNGANDGGHEENIMDSPTEAKFDSSLNTQRPAASSSSSKTSFVRQMKRRLKDYAAAKKMMLMSPDAADNDGSNESNSNEWDASYYYSQNYPSHNVKVKPTGQRSSQMSQISMWEAFAADITNDLSLLSDPLLQIETKAKVRQIVEQAVQDQLIQIQERNSPEKETICSEMDKTDDSDIACDSATDEAVDSATYVFCDSGSPSHPS